MVQPLSDELAKSFGLERAQGALVSEVVKGSPAERGGIKRGDVILKFDGQTVDERNDLPKIVAAAPIGKSVKVVVFRDGKERELKVEVGRLAEGDERPAVGADTGGRLGLAVGELTPDLARRHGLPPESRGVLINAIDPGSSAATANLRPGDLVVEVDGREIDSVQAFEAATGRVAKGGVLRLLIQRRDSLFYTTVRAE
jgi:serine protease Do